VFRPDGPNAFPARFAKLDRMHNEEPPLTVPDLAGYPGPSLVMVGDDEDETPIAYTLELPAGLPWSQPVIALFGMLAALYPAWRAGRLDVLDAIATE
jgi:hypothetical protein